MSTMYLNNSHTTTGDFIGARVGQKRSSVFSTGTAAETFEEYSSPKRGSPYYYTATTYLPENPDTSPKTPESGIDMNELGCSPPCYSVTRTTTAHHHLFENTADVPITSVPELPNPLQPGQCKDGFALVIVDEPEENYRARYDSEGCRGPMKGRNGGCPTVELITKQHQWSGADIKVELVAADKSPLNSCKLDSTDDGANLLKKAHPGERVSFENLRIRRLKKGDTNNRGVSAKHQPKQMLKGTRGKQDEKVAYLLFTAKVRTIYNTEVELKVLSQVIHLNASHDPPEIHCVVPQYASSGDPVAIIGTRMHSPRVSFLVHTDGKDQEIPAEINKEVSHQNALVIRVPQLPISSYCSNVANIQICVTAGKGDRTGKEPLKSNLVHFCCVLPNVCKECIMQPPHRLIPVVTRPAPSPPPPVIRSTNKQPISPIPRPPHPRSPPGGCISSPPATATTTMPPPPMTPCSSGYSTTYPVTVCQSPSQSVTIVDVNNGSGQQQQPPHQSSDLNEILSLPDPVTPSQTSSPYGVVSSDQQLMEGIGFSDTHSGPVSPDEFNCYLPNNSNPVVSGAYGRLASCSQQQEYTNVYSVSGIGVVQPTSLGQFMQNP